MSKILLLLLLVSHFCCAQKIYIKIESVQSLYIELYRDNRAITTATGFLIKSKTQNYLVTNYHVVTNRNPWDNNWIDSNFKIAPNRVAIYHNGIKLGDHVARFESLLDKEGNPLWHQNEINGQIVDVIELPLKDTDAINMYSVPYNNELSTKLKLEPTNMVFVVGFPLGLRGVSFTPIWKSGVISSEPDLNQENKPIIWVDVLGYHGMSGSPVYFISNRIKTKDGGDEISIGAEDKSVFIGVFSHFGPQNVYGALWKASYLNEIFNRLP